MVLYTADGVAVIQAFLMIIGEPLGSPALAVGLLARFTSTSFIVIMMGTIVMVHWLQNFFMNWFGRQQGRGLNIICS